jgi:hypothetical protein
MTIRVFPFFPLPFEHCFIGHARGESSTCTCEDILCGCRGCEALQLSMGGITAVYIVESSFVILNGMRCRSTFSKLTTKFVRSSDLATASDDT